MELALLMTRVRRFDLAPDGSFAVRNLGDADERVYPD
jgi:hypothetical protein